MKVTCGEHGKVQWYGEIVCTSCMRIYRLSDSEAYDDILPEMYPKCECGELLASDVAESTAAPICPHCFDKHYPRVLTV